MKRASLGRAIEGHDRFGHASGHQRGPARPPVPAATSSGSTDGHEPRSSFGALPGAELPGFVYVSVLAAFGWIMLASWLAFAGDTDADLALGIASVLALIFFALPIVMHHIAASFSQRKPHALREFLSAPVETATGPLPGASAWLQVLIIPLALALAATLFGAAYVLVR